MPLILASILIFPWVFSSAYILTSIPLPLKFLFSVTNHSFISLLNWDSGILKYLPLILTALSSLALIQFQIVRLFICRISAISAMV